MDIREAVKIGDLERNTEVLNRVRHKFNEEIVPNAYSLRSGEAGLQRSFTNTIRRWAIFGGHRSWTTIGARFVRPSTCASRFDVLSSEREDAIHVCRGRVAVRSSQIVLSAPKRFRLTCGNLHRMSRASTVPGSPQSLCDALEFDMARADSDHGIVANQPDLQVSESDATSSLVGNRVRSQ